MGVATSLGKAKRRRDFITGIAGSAAAWPLVVHAQQAKLPAIGVLVLGSPPPEAFLKGLRDGLRDVGYTEGRNIRLEIRNTEGKVDLLAEKAAELVRLKVDIIVAFQTPAATAAKQATGEIPIVMALVGDPVGTGLVGSYARPGGNVTGTAAGSTEVVGKTVELIREVFPSARRFAVLANETDPFTTPFLAAIGLAAGSAGMEMEPVMARPGEPLDAAFESMAAKLVNAVVIQGSMVRKEAVDLGPPSTADIDGRDWRFSCVPLSDMLPVGTLQSQRNPTSHQAQSCLHCRVSPPPKYN
jgi:putative tryptophan/tyrosine transport system substrate-binding protein